MRVTEVSVTVDKRVSDNNYGGKYVQVHLAASLDPGDDPMTVVQCLLTQAKTRVLVGLGAADEAPA